MRSWRDMGLRRGDFARISLSLSARHLKPTCFWDPRAPVHQQLRPSVIRRVNWPESRSCICTTLRHTGNGELGAVRLAEAQIGGRLDCSGAIIRNSSGPALRAGGPAGGRQGLPA
jgi:hypothetical protein